jgi:hypothetical protein
VKNEAFDLRAIVASIAQDGEDVAKAMSDAVSVTVTCHNSDKLSQLAQAINAVYFVVRGVALLQRQENDQARLHDRVDSLKASKVGTFNIADVNYTDEVLVNTLVLRRGAPDGVSTSIQRTATTTGLVKRVQEIVLPPPGVEAEKHKEYIGRLANMGPKWVVMISLFGPGILSLAMSQRFNATNFGKENALLCLSY